MSFKVVSFKSEDKAAAFRLRQIEDDMAIWIDASEQVYQAGKVFGELTVDDTTYQEKALRDLELHEEGMRHVFAISIASSATPRELNDLNFDKPGQIIGWAIKQGKLDDPSKVARYSVVSDNKDLKRHLAGSSDFFISRQG